MLSRQSLAWILTVAMMVGCTHQPTSSSNPDTAMTALPEPTAEDLALAPQHREPAAADEDDEGNTAESANNAEEDQNLNRLTPQQQLALRGNPGEFDPGPPPNSKWAELFARVPNFRSIGVAMIRGHGEKFRWTFGPMFYRGRLAPNQVKVFVVGQEGAQDESLSNRSFTGGTGAKMMGYLNSIGINRSYLFMNTFAYTINGQYSEPELKNLAQNPRSPVVLHRHEMFNYMLETNRGSLNMVIAVGTAAKDTVRTWIRSRGGKCDFVEETGTKCDGSVLGSNIQVIGVKHPGAAGKNPSAVTGLRKNFRTAFEVVMKRRSSTPQWLPMDPGAQVNARYNFDSAPVPFRDFAYSTTWRLGRGGTSSNRDDRQQSIQIFSAAGQYNNKNSKYERPKDADKKISDMPANEVEWEFMKSRPNEFDPGPLSPQLATLMMGGSAGFTYPDFSRLGVTSHASLGFMGPYRGRLHQAQVLVMTDQESVDDLFSARAMTGLGGQRFQTFLNAIGIRSQYAILRVLPVDVSDLDVRKQISIATHPDVTKIRQAVLDEVIKQSHPKLILAVGPVSAEALKSYRTSIPIVNMAASTDAQFAGQWVSVAQQLNQKKPVALSTEVAPVSYNPAVLTAIPRADLPFHSRWWMGTSGSRAARGMGSGKMDGNYYKLYMPDWVFRLSPKTLSPAEGGMIEQIKRSPVTEASSD